MPCHSAGKELLGQLSCSSSSVHAPACVPLEGLFARTNYFGSTRSQLMPCCQQMAVTAILYSRKALPGCTSPVSTLRCSQPPRLRYLAHLQLSSPAVFASLCWDSHVEHMAAADSQPAWAPLVPLSGFPRPLGPALAVAQVYSKHSISRPSQAFDAYVSALARGSQPSQADCKQMSLKFHRGQSHLHNLLSKFPSFVIFFTFIERFQHMCSAAILRNVQYSCCGL